MLTVVELQNGSNYRVTTFNPANITAIEHSLYGMKVWQTDGKYSHFDITARDSLACVEKIAACLTDDIVIVCTDKMYAIRCANGQPLPAIVDDCKAGFELVE